MADHVAAISLINCPAVAKHNLYNMYKVIKYSILCMAIGVSACKVPYNPPPITVNNNYLVVEGIINISDSTFINLAVPLP